MPLLRTRLVVMDDYGRQELIKTIDHDLPDDWDDWTTTQRLFFIDHATSSTLEQHTDVTSEVLP